MPKGRMRLTRASLMPDRDLVHRAARSVALRLAAAAVTFEGYRSEWPVIAGMSIGSSGAPLSRNFAFEHFKLTNGVTLTNFTDANLSYDEIALSETPPSSCSGPPRTGTCAVRTP